MLLRRLFEAPISTPGESLYLESGSVPVSFILKGRRIMFFHYLVTRNSNEMLYKFTARNDWTETVKNDFEFFNLDLNIETIKSYKKEKFAKIVQKKVKEAAFQYLLDKKSDHSKMDGIVYDQELNTQEYLKNSSFSPHLAKLLFKFRCRMIQVRMNFKLSHADFNCPLCLKNEVAPEYFSDSQSHLLTCSVIRRSSIVLSANTTVKYEHIFSKNTDEMLQAIKLLKISLKIREQLLNMYEERAQKKD